jgi:RHS repeat-associated protein
MVSEAPDRRATVSIVPGVTVTPDGGTSGGLVPNSPITVWFTVNNTDTSPATYNYTAVCSGAAIASACTPWFTTLTSNPNGPGAFSVTFTSGGAATSGRVKLIATLASNPAVKDSGWIDVLTQTVSVQASPDNQNSNLLAKSNHSLVFTVQNSGQASITYNFSATCTGTALVGSPCTPTFASYPLDPGMYVNVPVPIATTDIGNTGRVVLVATPAGFPTKTDSAWINVTAIGSGQFAVGVTQDYQTFNTVRNSSLTHTFTVLNAGTVSNTFNLTPSCSGVAVTPTCTVSPTWVSLGSGASQSVTVSYGTNSTSLTGRVKLVASGTGSVSDSGWVDITVPAVRGFDVTPDTGTIWLMPNGNIARGFQVINTGNVSDTYNFSKLCTGDVFQVACTLDATSATVGPQLGTGVGITSTAGQNAKTGRAALYVTAASNPTVIDSAWVNVLTNLNPTISVTPDGGTRVGVPANASSVLIPFTMTGAGSFALTSTCTGAAITGGCFPQSTPQSIAAGQPWTMNVFVNTGASGTTGTITLRARWTTDTTVHDVGTITISTTAATGPAVAVAPDNFAHSGIAPNGPSFTPFTVTNTGNASTTYSLSAACDGVAIASTCLPSASSLTLAPNAYATVNVNFTSGAAATAGVVKLRAVSTANSTVKDSGTVNVRTLDPAVVTVTPDGNTVKPLANSSTTLNFRVQNTSAISSSLLYDVTTVCYGQAFASLCTPSTGQLQLNSGQSHHYPVIFTAGQAGTTGRVKVIVTPLAYPTLKDSGWVDVTPLATSNAVSAVAPKGGAVTYVVPSVAQSHTFSVQNLGGATATFNFTTNCTGQAIGTSCTVSPSSSSIGVGQIAAVTVNYTSSTALKTGKVTLISTLSTNSSVKDSGWVSINTGATGATTVEVTPKGGALSTAPNTGTFASFAVKNTGPAAGTFTLATTCTGPAITQGSCGAPSPASVTLAAGGTQSISMQFGGGQTSGATGRVKLVATFSGTPTHKDSGYVDVVVSAPVVVVTPDSQAVQLLVNTSAQAQFTVFNPKTTTEQFQIAVVCSGAGIAGPCIAPPLSIVQLAPNASQVLTVGYTTAGAPGTGVIKLHATSVWSPTSNDSGWVNLTVTNTPVAGLSITPVDTTISVAANTSGNAAFTVKNTGTLAGNYTYSAICSAVSGTCTPSPASTSGLAPGSAVTVSVAYTGVGALSKGTVQLLANLATPAIQATGKITLSAGPVAGTTPTVVLADAAAGIRIQRSLCLAIALGDAAASECGDLRLTHALPSVTTLGQTRTPTLIYSSAHARPLPLIPFLVTIPAGATAPTTLEAKLTVGGHEKAKLQWKGDSLQPGKTHRLLIGYDAANDSSGIHGFSLQVLSYYAATNSWKDSVTISGRLSVVNRSLSPYGAGWWIAGLERLIVYGTDSLAWIGGDGSTRRFTPGAANKYIGVRVDFPDTITYNPSTATYVRPLPGGVQVEFSATGLHTATVNRLGYRTQFIYVPGTTRLESLRVPTPSGHLSYTFSYSPTTAKLQSVTAPPLGATPRTVQIGIANGLTNTITDLDGYAVSFAHEAATWPRITARTGKRGFSDVFAYDNASKVRRASRWTGILTDSITWSIRNADLAGLMGPDAHPVDTAKVFTLVDGPRALPVGDSTAFWLDSFGAPRKIVNALGDTTLIARGNTTFEALVTEVEPRAAGNGYKTTATYDARGNMLTRTEVNPYTAGASATWNYKWDAKWDFVARVTPPIGPADTMQYDATNGNRLWQQAGNDNARRVQFTYHPTGLLRTIATPGISGVDSLGYDALGNLARERTPRKYWTEYRRDAIGRVTHTYSTILASDSVVESNDAQRRLLRREYDLMDRVTIEVDSAPAIGRTVPQALLVTRTYTREGHDSTISRQSIPNPNSITALTIAYGYDPIGRRVSETSPDGKVDQWGYDHAGNVVTTITRRGDVLTSDYDAMNRLAVRHVPEKQFTQMIWEGFQFPRSSIASQFRLKSDDAVFTYYWNGTIKDADNGHAKIHREIYPSGRLKLETQRIRDYDSLSTDFNKHVYTLQYTYDLAGRRSSLTRPSGTTLTYGYHPDVGELESVTEGQLTVQHYYDLAGRVWQTHRPGQGASVTEVTGYDADSRRVYRRLTDVNGTELRRDSVRFDARSNIVFARTLADSTRLSYSGLGALDSTAKYPTNPAGQITSEQLNLDAFANLTSTTANWNAFPGRSLTYEAATGRVQTIQHPSILQTSAYIYDQSGNAEYFGVSETTQSNCTNPLQLDVRQRAFYDAEQRLRVLDKQTYFFQGCSPPGSAYGAFEEYRYDALGRRVLRRSQRPECFESLKCPSTIERFVWDDAQLIQEIRYPGRPSADLERDSGYITHQYYLCPPLGCTPADSQTAQQQTIYESQWGVVEYAYGRDLDHPLWLRKKFHGDSTNQVGDVVTFPHYDWRGEASGGTTTAGQLDVGLKVPWPAQNVTMYGWDTYTNPNVRAWFGSVIQSLRDESGLTYRRNRYYDPGTGRFTQEDPIGLAGGLNLYGFANGDPVNFSDPFGLCPPEDRNLSDCVGFWTVAGVMTGALLGGAGGGTGGFVFGGGFGAVRGGALGAKKGALLGARVGAFVDAVVWASKQADAIAKAESYVDHIESHLNSLGEEPNGPPSSGWRREVRAGIQNVQKAMKNMKDKAREEWQKRIDEWTRRLDENTPR